MTCREQNARTERPANTPRERAISADLCPLNLISAGGSSAADKTGRLAGGARGVPRYTPSNDLRLLRPRRSEIDVWGASPALVAAAWLYVETFSSGSSAEAVRSHFESGPGPRFVDRRPVVVRGVIGWALSRVGTRVPSARDTDGAITQLPARLLLIGED